MVTNRMELGRCEMEKLVIELLLVEKNEGVKINHLRELLQKLVKQNNK